MDVKQAVSLAKQHVLDLFSEEQLSNLGLEEVEFDDPDNEWRVTLGFSRPWDDPKNVFAAFSREGTYPKRSFKVVRISNGTGQVLSVKNRESVQEPAT
jgi:hypothetical protein